MSCLSQQEQINCFLPKQMRNLLRIMLYSCRVTRINSSICSQLWKQNFLPMHVYFLKFYMHTPLFLFILEYYSVVCSLITQILNPYVLHLSLSLWISVNSTKHLRYGAFSIQQWTQRCLLKYRVAFWRVQVLKSGCSFVYFLIKKDLLIVYKDAATW